MQTAYNMPEAQLSPDDGDGLADAADSEFHEWMGRLTSPAKIAALRTDAARESYIAARVPELERERADAKAEAHMTAWADA